MFTLGVISAGRTAKSVWFGGERNYNARRAVLIHPDAIENGSNGEPRWHRQCGAAYLWLEFGQARIGQARRMAFILSSSKTSESRLLC